MKTTQHIRIAAMTTMAMLFAGMVNGQDARFTQSFYSNPLKLNPAIMGMNTDLKAMINYRSQWGAVGNGFKSYSFTGLYPLFIKEGKEKLDLGLNILSDKEGAFSELDASISVGYNLQVSDAGYLAFALTGGLNQKKLDASELTFDDQYVLGTYNSGNATAQIVPSEKAGSPDVGFGIMWYYNPDDEDVKLNAYVGLSGYHLNEPNQTFLDGSGRLPRKYSVQGGVKIKGKDKIDFTPNIVANLQGPAEEIAGGVIIDYHFKEDMKVMLGMWYRKQDAYPIMVGFEHSNFVFNYSYDVTSSQLSRAIAGLNTHEITLAFKLNMAKKKGVDVMPSFF